MSHSHGNAHTRSDSERAPTPPSRSSHHSHGTVEMDAAVRRLSLRFNTTACLSVLSAILAYCVAEDDAQVLAVFSVIGCGAGWMLGRGRRLPTGEWSGRPVSLPKFVINLLVLLSLLHAAFNVFGGGFGEVRFGTPIVSILAQFLVFIQLIKLLDRSTPRDDAHVLGLSVFVVIGAILTSNDLLVGVFLLAYTPLVIAAAMMLQLIAGYRAVHDWSARTLPPASGHPAVVTAYIIGRATRRDFRRAGIASFVLIVSLATAAFVFTPRGLGENILGTFGRVGAGSRIGFTDSVQLGRSGRLSDDATPVLDVEVFDSQGQNIGAQLGTLYLRGAVNNYYDRRTRSWEFRPAPDFGLLQIGSLRPDNPVQFNQARGATGVLTQRITFRRGNLRDAYLFTIWRPISIQNVSRPLRIDPPGQERILRVRDDDESKLLTYVVRSAQEYADPADFVRINGRLESEPIRELALRLVTDRGLTGEPTEWTPDIVRRAVSAFQEHLRSTCTYSLDQIPPSAQEDPIEMFIFRTQQGHCEYFASALVAMCQSIGIDARLVAGYLAAQFDSDAGVFRVQESNAHAWAEVRVAPGRWQQFDPSPPDAINRQHRGSGGLMARLRRLYDAINFSWSSTVVSFDRSKQNSLMGSPPGNTRNDWREQIMNAELWRRLSALTLRRAIAIAAACVLAVGALWMLRRAIVGTASVLRSRRSRTSAYTPPDRAMQELLEQAGFYQRLLTLLRRAGLEKPDSTPPLTHVRLAASAGRLPADDAERLTDLYYQIRFGREPLEPSQTQFAQDALARIERAIAAPQPSTSDSTKQR